MLPSILKRIYNLIKRPLVLVLLVLSILLIFQQIKLIPKFSEWFKSKPLLIENTPLVITQIKNIAELQTTQMYAELVADSTILTTAGIANSTLRSIGMIPLPLPEKRTLVLIIKGKVIAGIDLKMMTEKDLFVKEDSVSMTLPPAKILDVITNPSDIETFIESGSWSEDEVKAVKNAARRQLLEEANRQQLLQKATLRSRIIIEQLLRSMGFKKVTLQPEGTS
ncbi:MAG: DUF4230 domain-containing protein [Bacteroidota bacterium]